MKFDIGDMPDGSLALRFTQGGMQVMIGVTREDTAIMISRLQEKIKEPK